jgi:hypothetical protein
MPEKNNPETPFIIFKQLAYILHDKFGFDKKQLTELLAEWASLADDIHNDRLSFADIVETMCEEGVMPDVLCKK